MAKKDIIVQTEALTEGQRAALELAKPKPIPRVALRPTVQVPEGVAEEDAWPHRAGEYELASYTKANPEVRLLVGGKPAPLTDEIAFALVTYHPELFKPIEEIVPATPAPMEAEKGGEGDVKPTE